MDHRVGTGDRPGQITSVIRLFSDWRANSIGSAGPASHQPSRNGKLPGRHTSEPQPMQAKD